MKKKKILIVDDEVSIRDMLETAFSKASHSVCSTASGEEALAILGHEYFPVMFIDLDLETMNGFELCEKIRMDKPDAIIYALTGYAKLFGSHEIVEAGFDNYTAKFFSVKTLYQVVEESFEKIDQIAKNNAPNPISIKRILIIDDDNNFRRMLGKILKIEGYEVMEASDGEEGIKRQLGQPADLIITDMIMPKKNGIETILEIKEMYPKSKFVAVSGGGWCVFEIEFNIAQKLGAVTLEKPFRREEMLSAIKQLQN